jgi:arylsulfatase A-like enzyme
MDEEPDISSPRNVCVVLLDSLNRHLLGSYGGTEFDTPNLDRFAAERAVRFTRHVTGSLPCMPARHDILCGALDFLWKPWGSIEVWEEPITRSLHRVGVVSHLATDHPHLFETGGENYHTDFTAWEYVRGHESDPWRTYPDPSWVGTPALPARRGDWFFQRRFGTGFERHYDLARTFLRSEEDYPGPRTMSDAARFLRHATPHHDRWFLFVDEFDPHEPFDTPERWANRYQDASWDEPHIIWPPYVNGGISSGLLSDAEGRNIRANYGAKLSMIDHWFGVVLDAFDELDLWATTALIVCTDHGHYLGEVRGGHDIWGKPGVPQYEPIGHTPLLIHWPGRAGSTTCDALTTNVDLFATIADVYGVTVRQRTHGRSLVPLLDGSATSVREWALGGVWGGWVQVTDGDQKYVRGPATANAPLSMWSNRWSSMPVPIAGFESLPAPDQRAWLDTMPGSDIPVIRQPFETGDRLPLFANPAAVGDHHLYDLRVDPAEAENRIGEAAEGEMIELLRTALAAVEAPAEQFARLGLD